MTEASITGEKKTEVVTDTDDIFFGIKRLEKTLYIVVTMLTALLGASFTVAVLYIVGCLRG